MSSKRNYFLSQMNKAVMIKRIFAAHQNDGGSRPLEYFQEQVVGLMNNWTKINHADSYDSLVFDPVSEREQINTAFFKDVWPQFQVGQGFRHIKKLDTVDDYLNYDIERAPEAASTIVDSTVYRNNNRIPHWQIRNTRNYDFADDEFLGISRGLKNRMTGDMDALWSRVNEPTASMDYNDEVYYGQTRDESTSTQLMDTSWN